MHLPHELPTRRDAWQETGNLPSQYNPDLAMLTLFNGGSIEKYVWSVKRGVAGPLRCRQPTIPTEMSSDPLNLVIRG